jgi:hypothetical protein
MTQTFDVALSRLQGLLRHEQWPERLVWVDLTQVIVFPLTATFIYLPRRSGDLERARRTFDSTRDRGLAIEIYGVGFRDDTTYAAVRPTEELAQREAMFLEDNVKVGIQGRPTPVTTVSSALQWWLVRRRYRRWVRRRDLGLGMA